MEWTTDKPTEPGWYWVCGDQTAMACVFVILDSWQGLDLRNASCGNWGCYGILAEDITHWLGPVPANKVPDPPYQVEPAPAQQKLTQEEIDEIHKRTIERQLAEGAVLGNWRKKGNDKLDDKPDKEIVE